MNTPTLTKKLAPVIDTKPYPQVPPTGAMNLLAAFEGAAFDGAAGQPGGRKKRKSMKKKKTKKRKYMKKKKTKKRKSMKKRK